MRRFNEDALFSIMVDVYARQEPEILENFIDFEITRNVIAALESVRPKENFYEPDDEGSDDEIDLREGWDNCKDTVNQKINEAIKSIR